MKQKVTLMEAKNCFQFRISRANELINSNLQHVSEFQRLRNTNKPEVLKFLFGIKSRTYEAT